MFIYFCFLFCFNFLTVHHKKFTLSDSHQEVTFNQYFYLYQEFMFCVLFCLFVCLFLVFRLLQNWSKEKLLIFGKDLDHILDTKIINFHRSHFSVF